MPQPIAARMLRPNTTAGRTASRPVARVRRQPRSRPIHGFG
ncbi:hypothetical protein ACFVFS_34020 [Kitasatospora sp. NPDC057692]